MVEQDLSVDDDAPTTRSPEEGLIEVISPSRTPAPPPTPPERCKLLYSKSKVYVHPTNFARDNVPGYLALVDRAQPGSARADALLAWLPESLVRERDEEEQFVCVEEGGKDTVLVAPPPPRGESYAFSVPLAEVYSLIVYTPTISSWYGSITVNLSGGITLPTLYFHDDESRSTMLLLEQSRSGSTSTSRPTFPGHPSSPSPPPKPMTYPPPRPASPRVPPSWGGEELLQKLRLYVHLLRSRLEPNLFLVDPSASDTEVHGQPYFDDDALDGLSISDRDPVPANKRPLRGSATGSTGSSSAERDSRRTSVLHHAFASPRSAGRRPTPPDTPSPGVPFPSTFADESPAPVDPLTSAYRSTRFSILSSFAGITQQAKHAAHNILSHPLAQPIVPHLPDPVRSFAHANGELDRLSGLSGTREYDAARIYLAKWARLVAEEGERNRRREHEVQGGDEETSDLGVFELLSANVNLPKPSPTRNSTPISPAHWASLFDADGRPTVSEDEMRKRVFRSGLEPALRKQAWPFLLRVVPWDSTADERARIWAENAEEYALLKAEWDGNDEVLNRPSVVEERHRIKVDCLRTDRQQPLFATPDADKDAAAKEKVPAEEETGAQPVSNAHVRRLQGILLTWNFYERELGYVQGLSDLCAPIYVVSGAEEMYTFWLFVKVMERMKSNFLRDQSGMTKQLLTMQQLIAVMDPELYQHFEKTDSLNLFFCFRWILINFKREFPFEDVLRLWEVLWSEYYTTRFVLFVALAVLESHRDVLTRYLVEFDEILKYCNELSGTVDLYTTLAQAEVLFLSFRQLVNSVDRKAAEQASLKPATDDAELRQRRRTATATGSSSEPSEADTGAALARSTAINDNLRELLVREGA